MPTKRRNKKNRYGMLKQSGRRFRAERMNIFGMRKTTEFSIDEVCVVWRLFACAKRECVLV